MTRSFHHRLLCKFHRKACRVVCKNLLSSLMAFTCSRRRECALHKKQKKAARWQGRIVYYLLYEETDLRATSQPFPTWSHFHFYFALLSFLTFAKHAEWKWSQLSAVKWNTAFKAPRALSPLLSFWPSPRYRSCCKRLSRVSRVSRSNEISSTCARCRRPFGNGGWPNSKRFKRMTF